MDLLCTQYAISRTTYPKRKGYTIAVATVIEDLYSTILGETNQKHFKNECTQTKIELNGFQVLMKMKQRKSRSISCKLQWQLYFRKMD